MNVNATLLAQAIADASTDELSPTTIDELASALGNGSGLALSADQLTVYVVLCSPLLATPAGTDNFRPVLVRGVRSKDKKKRKTRSTNEVGLYFRHLCQQLPNSRPKGFTHRWAVEGSNSSLRVPLGGITFEPTTITHHPDDPSVTHSWYNLDDVPLGNFVYSIDERGQGLLLQRVSGDQWAHVAFDGSQDLVPVHDVLQQIAQTFGEAVTGIVDDGEPTIKYIRNPSDRP